jgi:fused signal recognition particle receptor
MFGFKSRDEKQDSEPQKSKGLFASLRERLAKTRSNLSSGLADILLGKKKIDDSLLEQLEDQLLLADIGLFTTKDHFKPD